MHSAVDIARARLEYFAHEASAPRDTQPDASKPTGNATDFFGADGLSFRDVLDAINPLNQIPIISDLFARATEHNPSTASKLAGGAGLGGSIGFLTSLAEVIFENVAGSSPTEAAYAALTDSPAQLASAPAGEPAITITSLPEDLSGDAAPAPTMQAAMGPVTPVTTVAMGANNNVVLDLYGGSASAHESYKKAQLLPYLREVNASRVI